MPHIATSKVSHANCTDRDGNQRRVSTLDINPTHGMSAMPNSSTTGAGARKIARTPKRTIAPPAKASSASYIAVSALPPSALGDHHRDVLERSVELERKLVDRASDQQPEGILVVGIDQIEIVRELIVLGVAGGVFCRQQLCAAHDLLEVDLRLRVAPSRELHQRQHHRPAEDQGACRQDRDGLEKLDGQRLAETGETGPIWIQADRQTSGRGRRGRTWDSPTGNLAATLLLRPKRPTAECAQLSFVAALSTCDVVSHFVPAAETRLKWPNDVLIRGRKVCGILVETAHGKAIAGIGVNVNFEPSQVKDTPTDATSLSVESGLPVDRSDLVVALCGSLELWYRCLTREPGDVFAAWRARLETLGRDVIVQEASTRTRARALSVRPDGGLVVRPLNGSERVVYAADVSILPAG